MFRRRMTFTLLLLLLLFSRSSQDGQEQAVSLCGAQNLTVSGSDQTLLVTWDDQPSCSALSDSLVYQLTDEVSVAPDRIGSSHSWTWTSSLPLECVSHSVRLRSRFNNRTSSWDEERTLPGRNSSKGNEIFPQDKVFEVGSLATFCCLVPDGERFMTMYLSQRSGFNTTPEPIGDQRYSMRVRLEPAWDRCVDVKCRTTKGDYGACLYIGYRPDDRDLQCETRDLKSVECSWNEGRDTNLQLKSPTVYHLDGRKCQQKSKGRCSHEMKVDADEKKWILTAENKLGKVELHDEADLTKRVHMFAPEGVNASLVKARNVSLQWTWSVERYNHLNLTCQVQIKHHGRNTTTELSGVGLTEVHLTHLIPNWKYRVKLRCGTAQHFWKWGDWSHSVTFHTEGHVPDAPDVWMQMKENQTVIMWKKLLDHQSHGHITAYKVTWSKVGGMNEATLPVPPGDLSLSLSLDSREQHVVTVSARNEHGGSLPSTVVTPSVGSDEAGVKTSQISGSNGGFSLSWFGPAGSCGYIVDWSPVVGGGPVDWLKLPPNQTSVHISSESFTDGLRYVLSVYACTRGAPVLLQRREGYTKETRLKENMFKPLEITPLGSDFEVSWDPVRLREQPAFITGYILSYREQNGKVFNVTTDDPETRSLTVRDLRSGVYTFTVRALTAVGECGDTTITFNSNPQTNNLIKSVFISLGTVFTLLSLVTFFCYRHWTCISQKVYPPIPKPVVRDQWLTSPVKNNNLYFHTDQNHHSEEVTNIPQLYYKSGAPVNGYVKDEDATFPFSQFSNGYYCKPLTRSGPPLLDTCPSKISSGLPSFAFRGQFPNPSYNLMMDSSRSEPEAQDWKPGVKSSCGYKPQSSKETGSLNQNHEDSQSLITCNLAYILVPEPPS